MTYAPLLTPSYALSFVPFKVGNPCRVKTSAVGWSVDSRDTRHAACVSFPSAGLIKDRPGIARNEGNCSIGSCVGPSSPTAIESWVNTYVTGVCIIEDKRTAGRK